MLNKILDLIKFKKTFKQNESSVNKSSGSHDDKLDNGLDTLAAVKRYVNLKDSPYILKRGDDMYEYFLESSETGSVIMRFRSALKDYSELADV